MGDGPTNGRWFSGRLSSGGFAVAAGIVGISCATINIALRQGAMVGFGIAVGLVTFLVTAPITARRLAIAAQSPRLAVLWPTRQGLRRQSAQFTARMILVLGVPVGVATWRAERLGALLSGFVLSAAVGGVVEYRRVGRWEHERAASYVVRRKPRTYAISGPVAPIWCDRGISTVSSAMVSRSEVKLPVGCDAAFAFFETPQSMAAVDGFVEAFGTMGPDEEGWLLFRHPDGTESKVEWRVVQYEPPHRCVTEEISPISGTSQRLAAVETNVYEAMPDGCLLVRTCTYDFPGLTVLEKENYWHQMSDSVRSSHQRTLDSVAGALIAKQGTGDGS